MNEWNPTGRWRKSWTSPWRLTSAPGRLELVHEPGFDEQAVLGVLARVHQLEDAREQGMGLGLVSYAGEVAVGEENGQSVLNGLRVALGGVLRTDDLPTVTMAGDLHLRSLDLESRASIAGSADVACPTMLPRICN